MSYLVLARKWRPQCFEDLIGQEHVARTLGNAISQGRIHHAYLFSGPRGVGKTSAARIFAKALNCEKGLSPVPCNECPSCLEITGGSGVDVLEIDGASNTGVDDIRDLRENIRYLPSRSRFKIFIIDEVHMLSINAFNALLKVLEEPPEHAKFLFATTEPHKIPPTILSRCQRFDFRKIPLVRMTERLGTIAEKENIEISSQALGLIASQAEGGMRDALSALDQIIAYCGEKIADEDVQGILGLIDRRLIEDMAAALLARDSGLVLEILSRVDDQGFSVRQFCKDLIETFRGLLHLKVLKGSQYTPAFFQEDSGALKQLAEGATFEDLQRDMAALLKVERDLSVATLPFINLETALLRICHLPPARPLESLLQKLEDLEKKFGVGDKGFQAPSVVPAPKVEPDPAPAPATEKKTETGDTWDDFLTYVGAHHPFIASYLKNGHLLGFQLPRIELGFRENSFEIGQLKDQENLALLDSEGEKFFGCKVHLSLVAQKAEAFAEKTDPAELKRQQLREETLNHPAVKAVLKVFGGEAEEVRELEPAYEKKP